MWLTPLPHNNIQCSTYVEFANGCVPSVGEWTVLGPYSVKCRYFSTVLCACKFTPFSFLSRTFAAGNKIKQFYELLVEDSLRREDVDTMSRENMRNLHELMQSFRFSNVCFWSYLSRTCLEIVLSISLFFIYFCWGMPNLKREIECDVHGLLHSCVLPNHQFYFYILAVSSALLCVYILCNMYNLVWIVCPQLGTMYRIIKRYQDHMTDSAYDILRKKSVLVAGGASSQRSGNQQQQHQPHAISTENFLAVYFDRRHKDLKLLLNLLAETSGLPESFRILTLFDKKFQSLWKPQNLRFEEYTTVLPSQKIKSHSIIVRWNDAPIGHFLANYDSSLSFEYTIDINPAPQNELGLKSVLYKKEGGSVKRSPSEGGKAPYLSNHRHLSAGGGGGGGGGGGNRKSSESNNLESFHLLESGRTATTTTVVAQSEEDVLGDKEQPSVSIQQPHGGGGEQTRPSTAPAPAPTPASVPAPSAAVRDSYRYEVVFDNIVAQEEEYTVTISTELNGRTVTQAVEKFPMGTTEGAP